MTERPDPKAFQVLVLGVNHITGSVNLRDRLLFSETDRKDFSRELLRSSSLHEVVIVSTCNRSEIYAISTDPMADRKAIEIAWGGCKSISEDEIRNHCYFFAREDAIRHLFKVIASLDSMVLGEMQIFGQLKDAYSEAFANGTVDFYFNHLFQSAMRVGKRVRTETSIHEGAVSISYAAVELAKKVLGELRGKTVGVVGAGEMGELTALNLQKAGVEKFIFFNRSLGAAEKLAADFGGEVCLLESMHTMLDRCDIVVSSTGAPETVISKEQVQDAMRQRHGKPLFLIDIAAPRDIDSRVGEIYNTFLFTIDDLKSMVTENVALRKVAAAKAEEIIEAELVKAQSWFEGLDVIPVILNLRRKYEDMAERELKKWGAGLSPEQTKAMQGLCRSLVNKFLHIPTTRLKQLGAEGEGGKAGYYAQRLFALAEEEKNEQ